MKIDQLTVGLIQTGIHAVCFLFLFPQAIYFMFKPNLTVNPDGYESTTKRNSNHPANDIENRNINKNIDDGKKDTKCNNTNDNESIDVFAMTPLPSNVNELNVNEPSSVNTDIIISTSKSNNEAARLVVHRTDVNKASNIDEKTALKIETTRNHGQLQIETGHNHKVHVVSSLSTSTSETEFEIEKKNVNICNQDSTITITDKDKNNKNNKNNNKNTNQKKIKKDEFEAIDIALPNSDHDHDRLSIASVKKNEYKPKYGEKQLLNWCSTVVLLNFLGCSIIVVDKVFISGFDNWMNGYSIGLQIGTYFYAFASFVQRFVLIFTLNFTFKKSRYECNNNTMKFIKYIAILTITSILIFCLITTLVLNNVVFFGVEMNSNKTSLIRHGLLIVSIFIIVFEWTYNICICSLFIKKIYQIGKDLSHFNRIGYLDNNLKHEARKLLLNSSIQFLLLSIFLAFVTAFVSIVCVILTSMITTVDMNIYIDFTITSITATLRSTMITIVGPFSVKLYRIICCPCHSCCKCCFKFIANVTSCCHQLQHDSNDDSTKK